MNIITDFDEPTTVKKVSTDIFKESNISLDKAQIALLDKESKLKDD